MFIKTLKFYATDENVGGEKAGESETQSTATEEKKFTQEQVNEMIRERLARQEKSFLEQLKVNDKNTLEDIVKNSSILHDENATLKQKLAFIENNINPDKQEDILALFKGKGLEFNDEELKKMLPNHQEWLKEKVATTTITNMGKDHSSDKSKGIDEKEMAKKYFGLEGFVK